MNGFAERYLLDSKGNIPVTRLSKNTLATFVQARHKPRHSLRPALLTTYHRVQVDGVAIFYRQGG